MDLKIGTAVRRCGGTTVRRYGGSKLYLARYVGAVRIAARLCRKNVTTKVLMVLEFSSTAVHVLNLVIVSMAQNTLGTTSGTSKCEPYPST